MVKFGHIHRGPDTNATKDILVSSRLPYAHRYILDPSVFNKSGEFSEIDLGLLIITYLI